MHDGPVVTASSSPAARCPPTAPIDGLDITPLLTGKGPSPRDTMFYYRGTKLYAVRHGPWKAHFITRPAYGDGQPREHDPPLLYHLGRDPGEKTDVAKDHPEVVAQLKEVAAKHRGGHEAGRAAVGEALPEKK